MAILPENTLKFIQQNDPDLLTHLDFQTLRKEGLTHIGQLSGKIWTDHNAHDPGITILETLCYALVDLGYRTKLPFEDIIAKEQSGGIDDNFLTPLEALTVNPVTITDYRKLLLEIPGIRNAWLEPIDSGSNLWVQEESDGTTNLICSQENFSGNENFTSVQLNGLYKVLLEKEKEASVDTVTQAARELLSAHRNLCEDFQEINVLESVDIGVCATIDLLPQANAEAVYRTIIQELRQFIQPAIQYYTLKEMLDKGKSIEDVFAGRPFLKESVGFIDTEELEQLPFRKAIYLSDIYKVILDVDGVRKLTKIHIRGGIELNEDNQRWIERVDLSGKAAVFSLENTCIDLHNQSGIVKLNKIKIHQSFADKTKALLASTLLNTSIPPGIYRKDLSDYHSIQHDFPVVYGIGEEGLPKSTSLKRKTQALQLKGYLLFYDQILADYLAQLSSIRSLFSFKAEYKKTIDEKHSYATQSPDSVTGIEQLIRFYDGKSSPTNSGNIATPIPNNELWHNTKQALLKNGRAVFSIKNHCDKTDTRATNQLDHFKADSTILRSIQINQLVDAFNDGAYSIEILRDKFGCFFVFQLNTIPDLVLIGNKRFKNIVDARQAAEEASFIATLEGNYAFSTRQNQAGGNDTHFFDLVYQPSAYAKYIQQLSEDDGLYYQRRKQFLDHLLARFSEQFTDYTLLKFHANETALEADQNAVNKQSLFLNNYADISRNRGKAFNYLKKAWNTDNVSGFEKRIAALLGIENSQRQNLCNFEVNQCFKSKLKDDKGGILYRNSQTYDSYEAMEADAKILLQSFKDPSQYDQLEGKLQGFNRKAVTRMFSPVPSKENILISKRHHHIELRGHDNKLVRISKNETYTSQEVAVKALPDFIKNINQQKTPDDVITDKKLRLLALNKKDNTYLDANALDVDIQALISWRWHLLSVDTKIEIASPIAFDKETDAWQHLEKNAKLQDYLTVEDHSWRWTIKLPFSDFVLTGLRWYPNIKNAQTAWLQAKLLGQDVQYFSIEKGIKGQQIILLKNPAGDLIARSKPTKDAATILTSLVELFNAKRITPDYDRERGKYSFHIPNTKGVVILNSYCAYRSKKEALLAMAEVFELGSLKKHYFLTGDVANPNYFFLLQNSSNDFLAQTTTSFESSKLRDKTLNATIRFLKANKMPVTVIEEPRRYQWSFSSGKTPLQSEAEYISRAVALKNFDATIVRHLQEGKFKELGVHVYKPQLANKPAKYRYIYGVSAEAGAWQPLFQSKQEFTTKEKGAKEYTHFINQLGELEFKNTKPATGFDYQLIDKKTNKAVVVQFKDGSKKASKERAKSVHHFIKSAFTGNTVNDRFVTEQMLGSTAAKYQWRFYKKNAPIAIVPWKCNSESINQLLEFVCNLDPFIDLGQCPKKEVVICPKNDPDKYHFQLRFGIKNATKEFVLNSYVGYNSYKEALDAYNEQWFEIIQLAKNIKNYGKEGIISTEEVYGKVNKNACTQDTTKVVIPKECIDLAEGNVDLLIEYFSKFATIFPIYSIKEGEEGEEKTYYKFKVALSADSNLGSGCKYTASETNEGTIIWQSTECYESIEQAINAYQGFRPIAANPDACRVFCQDGVYKIGAFEILAESICDFNTEDEAWNQRDGKEIKTDECGNCLSEGVRAFVEAAENEDAFICIPDGETWSFKVVAPDYYVVKHNCSYDSALIRDQAIEEWREYLKDLDWTKYIPILASGSKYESDTKYSPKLDNRQDSVYTFSWGQQLTIDCDLYDSLGNEKWLCRLAKAINICVKNDTFSTQNYNKQLKSLNQCIEGLGKLIKNPEIPLEPLIEMAIRYPVYTFSWGQQLIVDCDLFNNLGNEKWLCRLAKAIRDCVKDDTFLTQEYSQQLQLLNQCIEGIGTLVKNPEIPLESLIEMANRYPLYTFSWGQQLIVDCDLFSNLEDEIWLCEFTEAIRDCAKNYTFASLKYDQQLQMLNQCLEGIGLLINEPEIPFDKLIEMASQYPIYKTDKGYCFRLYDPKNDKPQAPLKRCGCEKVTSTEIDPSTSHRTDCSSIYPFEGQQCYDCYPAALAAFRSFCALIVDQKHEILPTSIDCNGPYGFNIINPERVLAYHPQQYNSLEAAKQAIQRTSDCINNLGMHLVEHILLRPQKNDSAKEKCFLPVCPDTDCRLKWQLTDDDDPCIDDTPSINYLPGSDPYSFWATIVLPSWKKPFRDADARRTIERLLYQEIPVLVGLNILWLSPKDCCKFEDEYRVWLDGYSSLYSGSTTQCSDPEFALECGLVDCISNLQSEPSCSIPSGNDASCDCKEVPVKPNEGCCLATETTGTIFWAECEQEKITRIEEAKPDVVIVEEPYDGLRSIAPETKIVIKTSKVSGTKPIKRKKKPVAKKAVAPKKVVTKKPKASPKKKVSSVVLIRQRQAQYLANVQALVTDKANTPETHKRTIFFLENPVSMPGYLQLLKYFTQYHLGKSKGISQGQLFELLSNASQLLFDKIILGQIANLSADDFKNLKENLDAAHKKGFDLTALNQAWKPNELKKLTSVKVKALTQIKSMLKT